MAGMYADLEGRNVLVTGGAGGIGLACVKAFLANGANVIIVDRSKDAIAAAAAALPRKVHEVPCDLSDLASIPPTIKEIEETLGPIDALLNIAGINMKKDAVEVSDRDFESVIKVNQTAVFSLTREVGKLMVVRGRGSIIMISSMAAQYGMPKVIAYTASKTAIEGMTRALAVEWSPFGVRINCLAPGFIRTPMSAKALDSDPERKGRALGRTPMGTLGEPEDVANAALFLCSAQAKFITGVVLPVDGGNCISF